MPMLAGKLKSAAKKRHWLDKNSIQLGKAWQEAGEWKFNTAITTREDFKKDRCGKAGS